VLQYVAIVGYAILYCRALSNSRPIWSEFGIYLWIEPTLFLWLLLKAFYCKIECTENARFYLIISSKDSFCDHLKTHCGTQWHRLGCKACEPQKCPCYKAVNERGLYGLDSRHQLNDSNYKIIWRAIKRARVPASGRITGGRWGLAPWKTGWPPRHTWFVRVQGGL